MFPENLPLRLRQATLWLALLALTACSGGGGSGGVTPQTTANNDSYTVNLNQTRVVPSPGVLTNDTGAGATMTVTLVSPPAKASAFTLNSNGSFTYTHNGTGTSDTFTYQLTSGGVSATATVTINIVQPPVANNGCKNGPWNTPLTVDLKSYATDPQLTFSILSQGSKGTVSVPVDGVVTYQPFGPTVTGADSFTYQATNPAGGTATGQVKIAIGNRIMPLGDSITAGVFTSATNPSASERVGYRRKLYTDLTAGGKNVIDFVGRYNEGSNAAPAIADDAHEGRLGLSDTQLASEINARLSGLATDAGYTVQTSTLGNGNPDIVLLHIGTNGLDVSPYNQLNDVQAILDNIDTWEPSNRPVTVLLALIIGSPNSPAGNYNCATGVDCNANAIARNNDVATKAQTRIEFGSRLFLVDMYSALSNKTIGGDFSDNLHPNTSGYDKMATAWKNALIANGLACP